MGVSSSAVEIRVNVVDSNSAQAIQQVTSNIGAMGEAGANAGKKVASGLREMKRGYTESVENVRLLNDNLGLRLPRAMEDAVARSRVLADAINSVGAGLLAMGALDVGMRVAEGLYQAYDKWISLEAAAKAYADQVKKTKDEDFINVRDIETATDRIGQATAAAKDFKETAESMRGGLFGDTFRALMSGGMVAAGAAASMDIVGARKMADKGYHAQTQADALKGPMEGFRHERALDQIELEHAGDGRLRGEKKITAELQKQHAINAENRRHESATESLHGNSASANAGVAHQKALDEIATQKAKADTANLERQQAQELSHMREAALQASLRGEALYRAQEAAAIDDLKYKDMDSAAARNAVHAKFHAEDMRRLQDEGRATDKIVRDSSLAGMTGIARIRAEGANHIADLNADDNLNPANRQRRIAAAQNDTQQQVLAAQKEFSDRIDQISDESATHQIDGFARIRASAQREIHDLRREYEKLYGKDTNAPEYQAHLGELHRGESAIETGAGNQEADLARRNAEETASIEAQARARFLTGERQQTAAIESEYEERLRKYQEELNSRQISEDDYNRRVVAAAQERDGEMVQASREAREKMAGQFTGFFSSLDHPTQALHEFGMKAAGQSAAAMIQLAGARWGHGREGAKSPTEDGLLGGLFGHFGFHPGAPASGSTTLASVRAVTMPMAEIHIQSANVAFGSAGGGASSFRSMGSTAMMIPGSGFSAGGGTSGFGGGMGGFGGGGIGSMDAGSSAPGSVPAALGTDMGAAPGRNGLTSTMGLGTQAMGLGKTAMGIFHGGGASGGTADVLHSSVSGTLNADGTFTSGAGKGSMLGGGGVAANLGGAATGAMGLFGAYEGNGGVGGALSGAMSGMQLGMAVGGPMGAAVGAAAGAIMGAVGFGGREKARVYDLKEVRPRLKNDFDSFQQGSMDYLSTYSDLQNLYRDANMTTNSMGPAAKGYYQDTIKPEILAAMAKLTAEQKAGRSMYTAQAAQYDIGTDSVPHDGWAVIHRNERIFNSHQNERITRAVESLSGSSAYGGSRRRAVSHASGFGGDIHIHALDAKAGVQWLMENRHVVRKALNASYSENSGGADA